MGVHLVLFSGGNDYRVVKGTEGYTVTVIYGDAQAKTVGRISVKAGAAAAFNSNITTILKTAALGTSMGGSPSHGVLKTDSVWS